MTSSIIKPPNITYEESDSNPTWNGEGAYIPVFIGLTGNCVVDSENKPVLKNNSKQSLPIEIKKFKNYSSCRKDVALGGLGRDTETNPLLAALKDFFEESAKQFSDDISVPYVYVIDMSIIPLSDIESWTTAFELAKTKRDARVEVLAGLKVTDDKLEVASLLTAANTSIIKDSKTGIPRTLLTTIEDATDEELKEYTDDLTKVEITDPTDPSKKINAPAYTQESRIGITAPKLWGKIVGKICTTPYNIEPGYTDFRTIKGGVFDKRTDEEQEDLMNAGIIFIRDEAANSVIHPKICLAVSTSFAKVPENRPNDCLLHSRRNTDHLITTVYDTCYSQLKRNETKVNISHLQTDVDVIVKEEVEAGNMMEGTQCIVKESDTNPYNILVEGDAKPVNSTLYIHFTMYVSNPNVTVDE